MGSRGEWAKDFLRALGNTSPDGRTINLVAAWTAVEGTKAAFNPLATTLDYGENTNFNSVGVKNYKTRQQGVEASALTLNGTFSGYNALREGLASNDPEKALASGGFDTWGSHTVKVEGIYRSRNTVEENLLSEGEAINLPELWEEGAGREAADRTDEAIGSVTDSLTVTEDEVKSAAMVIGGIGLVIIGGIILIIAAMRSDALQGTVKDVAKVAAKVKGL